jgi:thiamine biosynthesis lipoprotein
MSSAVTEAAPGLDLGDTAVRSMRGIGTTAVVAITAPERADRALAMLDADLRNLDEACSRFRPDSELRRLERVSRRTPVEVSRLLFEALEVACVVAVQTAGIVDPTIGSALVELGYDRDFDRLHGAGAGPPAHPEPAHPEPAPGWWQILLDPTAGSVSIPAGVHVDLGATAKAFAADRTAQRIAAELGCGALVNLGGDVAVAGEAPPGGWSVGIAPDCRTPIDQVDQVVTVTSGGLATSGTTTRTWVRDGRRVHHIIDPWTGDVAPAVWSLVSATAPSCVEANAWTTAAVVWGEDAVGNLAAVGVPARLVGADGSAVHVGDWPAGDSGRWPPPADRARRDVGLRQVAG